MNPSKSMQSAPQRLPISIFQAVAGIGPAMIIAAVVLGPGSITTASKVGCRYGYSMGWVLVLATVLMIGMTLAAMLAGMQSSKSAASRIREKFGKSAAIVLGLVVFLIVALFQSSNNRAMLLAAEVLFPEISEHAMIAGGFLIGLNCLVILFFLFSPNVYKVIEKAMMLLVGTMLICFGINAVVGGVDFSALALGIFPSSNSLSKVSGELTGDLRGMVATTFSVAGAFYQCYLVQERRWTRDQFRVRWVDPVIGIATLGLLTTLVMGTAAASLHQKIEPDQIKDLSGLAASLRPTFGPVANIVFAAGILAGAISSFVGNALIGGTIFSDCLGMSASAKDRGPRTLTIVALAVGLVIALASVLAGMESVAFIIVAQSLTTLGLPILALVILWMLWSGDSRPKFLLGLVSVGIVAAFYVAGATLANLISRLG